MERTSFLVQVLALSNKSMTNFYIVFIASSGISFDPSGSINSAPVSSGSDFYVNRASFHVQQSWIMSKHVTWNETWNLWPKARSYLWSRLVLMLKEVFQISTPRLTANIESLEQLDITFHWCQLMLLLTCRLCRWGNKQFQPIVVDKSLSSMGFVFSTRHSFVNVWNCCWPIFCAFLTASTANGSSISLLSRTSRPSCSSSNELLSSPMKLTSEQTSFLNTFSALAV